MGKRVGSGYIARTRPGTDFPTRLERLLSQTEGQWRGVKAEVAAAARDWLPRRVTVREVLKYSRTWVIIPSVTDQAWTQVMLRARSWPSTKTVGPMASTLRGSNRKESPELAVPVRMRIKNWWDGGPWNHHSRSEARSFWTKSTSRELKASYRASTTLLFLVSSRVS